MERPALQRVLADAIRYWEPRRARYNLLLAAETLGWLVFTWPHFRPALTWLALLKLLVLAGLANVCYCAVYLVDIPMQYSAPLITRPRWRRTVFVLGTVSAAMLTWYWIGDEIYPYVR